MIEQIKEMRERMSQREQQKKEFEKNFAFAQEEEMRKFEDDYIAKKAKKEGWWETTGYYAGLKEVMQTIFKHKCLFKLKSHYNDVMPKCLGVKRDVSYIQIGKKGIKKVYMLDYLRSQYFHDACFSNCGFPAYIFEAVKKQNLIKTWRVNER
ncbi:MAG: hypothetical protein BV457_00285 [Thermoplasmata archaeon M9B1D]|nr:MAG: hypothetical protein BV457_00285 [Thermoplasmata archaeon M9B1D]PNX52197.1 MAG: hypothetical protein BV456_00010 [Thermoplasmata archaeon M8B2D]